MSEIERSEGYVMQTYGELTPTIADMSLWTLSRVLERQAANYGSKAFMRDEAGRVWTYQETNEYSRRIAGGFASMGLQAGDSIAIMSSNCLEYVLAWFGSACAGLTEVPISPYYRHDGLRRLINLARPRAIVLEPSLAETLLAAVSDLPAVLLLPLDGRDEAANRLRDSGATVRNFEELYLAAPLVQHTRSPHDLASVLFTSGTTGLPKGVRMSEAQLYFFSQQFSHYEALSPSDVYLHDKPMYTSLSHFHVVYACLIAGAEMVMYDMFHASLWSNRVQSSGATIVLLIGEMMDFIMKQPSRSGEEDNALRCVSCGPTAWHVVDGFIERFGKVVLAEAYGQTEISVPVMVPYGSEDRPQGSCGVGVDEWFELRIADPETDQERPVGSVGELQVRPKAPWIISDGYFQAAETTVETWRNLWFHTRDLFRQDADGWYYFVDRAGDAIRRRGHNVSSKEIEDVFLGQSEVAAAAAVSIGPLPGEESPEILVCLVTNEEISNQKLIELADERLPYFAVPRFIRRETQLPITGTGKVRRAKIREDGLTDSTWDRLAAGVRLRREVGQ